jgi:hypothetical protein
MKDLGHLFKKPTRNEITQMELDTHLEAMKALHITVIVLCRHLKISPKKLVDLSYEDLANELYNNQIIQAQRDFLIANPNGKVLKLRKNFIKYLFNKLWTKFQKLIKTSSDQVQN